MRTAFVFLAALAVGSAIGSAIAQEKDLSGDYAMKGTSLRPNSQGYAGECTLKRRDKVYDVNCVNTGSGDKYVGTGIYRATSLALSGRISGGL